MKLSEKEFQELQSNQQTSNEIIFAIGELELQKISLVDQYRELAQQQNKLGSELTEKYGDGKINLNTGEIIPIQPESSDESSTS
jgi:hypothetical protein